MIEYAHGDEKLVNINLRLMNQILGNKNEYYSYFHSLKNKGSKYVDEFLDFFNKCEKNDFKFIIYPSTIPKRYH